MKERKNLSNREFYGVEFYVRRQQEYDEARRFLKTCGRPKDDVGIFWIQFYKEQERFSSMFLDWALLLFQTELK